MASRVTSSLGNDPQGTGSTLQWFPDNIDLRCTSRWAFSCVLFCAHISIYCIICAGISCRLLDFAWSAEMILGDADVGFSVSRLAWINTVAELKESNRAFYLAIPIFPKTSDNDGQGTIMRKQVTAGFCAFKQFQLYHFLSFFARKNQLCYSRHHFQKHEHAMVYVISRG